MKNMVSGFLASIFIISLSACGGGSSSPAPTPPLAPLGDNTPPVQADAIQSYDGQRFTFVSDDQSCKGNILLSVSDSDITIIAENSTCWDLFKARFTLNCHQDGYCTGRLDKYLATIRAQLVDASTITFTIRNDVELVDHINTYHLAQ